MPPRDHNTRLNLCLTPSVRERLGRIQGRTEAASLAEVVRHAFAAYEYVVAKSRKGWTVVFENPVTGERETLKMLSCPSASAPAVCVESAGGLSTPP